ncbi:TPA: hypothetical protein JLG92_004742 [Escherichia coli]|nr:hypothetical protein [Escherichia coli]
MNDGWYQVRIAGRDAGETELSARLNEPLATWLPRAMFCLFCTVKCAWGLVWFLRRSARQMKGTVVRLW